MVVVSGRFSGGFPVEVCFPLTLEFPEGMKCAVAP